MHTFNHRWDHLHEGVGVFILRLVLRLFADFHASWGLLMERNGARCADAATDDILWDDGEPEQPGGKD